LDRAIEANPPAWGRPRILLRRRGPLWFVDFASILPKVLDWHNPAAARHLANPLLHYVNSGLAADQSMKKITSAIICTGVVVFLVSAAFGQRKGYDPPARHAIRGTRGAVATGSDAAAEAGMRMYYKGGNAVDAGVAAMFSGSIAEYSNFGFGGEAPILIRTKDGKVHSIAGVGTMPKAATADFFRQRKLLPGEMQTHRSRTG
jgi:hypothetical protein